MPGAYGIITSVRRSAWWTIEISFAIENLRTSFRHAITAWWRFRSGYTGGDAGDPRPRGRHGDPGRSHGNFASPLPARARHRDADRRGVRGRRAQRRRRGPGDPAGRGAPLPRDGGPRSADGRVDARDGPGYPHEGRGARRPRVVARSGQCRAPPDRSRANARWVVRAEAVPPLRGALHAGSRTMPTSPRSHGAFERRARSR